MDAHCMGLSSRSVLLKLYRLNSCSEMFLWSLKGMNGENMFCLFYSCHLFVYCLFHMSLNFVVVCVFEHFFFDRIRNIYDIMKMYRQWNYILLIMKKNYDRFFEKMLKVRQSVFRKGNIYSGMNFLYWKYTFTNSICYIFTETYTIYFPIDILNWVEWHKKYNKSGLVILISS